MRHENVYAINGAWFVYGMNVNAIYLENEKTKAKFYKIIDYVENKFKDKIIVPFQKGWSVSTFMYQDIIPSYHFQCSFLDKETAIESSKFIIDKLDKLVGNKTTVIIAIANGDVKNIGDLNSADGMAYVRSGTFIESPEVWMHKWNKDNRIFLLEGDYLVKPIVEIKRYKDI